MEACTNYNVQFRYFWKTRKVRSLSALKDLIIHKANIISKGICSCNDFYIGETKQKMERKLLY